MEPSKAIQNFKPEQLPSNGDGDGLATAYQLLGAVKAGGLISRSVGAEVIRTLQAIRDEKLYVYFGCTAFDKFLDEHPESPMSYYLFNQREGQLEKEGPLAFQLLNTLRIPAGKRKLLQSGEVNVTDEEVEINGEKFPISNGIEIRKLIVGILEEKSSVDQENKKLLGTIERGKKQNDRRKRRIGELEDQLSHGGITVDGTAHGQALVSTLGNHALLNQEIAKIEDETERLRFGSEAMERLAQARIELEVTLGFREPADAEVNPLDPNQ